MTTNINQLTEREVSAVHILTNWRDYQEGEDIHDEDVIRANNGMYYTDEERKAMRQKSMKHCPTYGNCNVCWGSGPVGMMCCTCNTATNGYQVVMVLIESMRSSSVIIDAENTARILGRDHNTAKGDRAVRWTRTPTRSVELLELRRVLGENDEAIDLLIRLFGILTADVSLW